MKLVRRRISIDAPRILITPISPHEWEEAAYDDRVRALRDWAATKPVRPGIGAWKHVALFLADQLLPGMQLGTPKWPGRPRRKHEDIVPPGPRSSLSRAEGKWLVAAISRLRREALARGERLSVKDAAEELKGSQTIKQFAKELAPSTLRRHYFGQQRLEKLRLQIEKKRREHVNEEKRKRELRK